MIHLWHNTTTYQEGCPIGKAESGPLAGIYMESLEEEFVYSEKCPWKINWWKRMKNDIMLVWEHTLEELEAFLEYMNSIDDRIKCTMEVEENGRIDMLDVQMEWNAEGKVETTVYRKPTNSNRYLHAKSNHPQNCKVRVMCTLIIRAFRYCSTKELFEKEVEFVKDSFINSGYSVRFTEKNN